MHITFTRWKGLSWQSEKFWWKDMGSSQKKKLTHPDVPSLASHSIPLCPCQTCLLRMMDIIISVIDVLLPYLKLKSKTIWHLVSINSISCGVVLHILLPVVLGYLKKNVFSVPINEDVCQVTRWNIWAVVKQIMEKRVFEMRPEYCRMMQC